MLKVFQLIFDKISSLILYYMDLYSIIYVRIVIKKIPIISELNHFFIILHFGYYLRDEFKIEKSEY